MKRSKTDTNGILLFGIGNSGRKDDGLGWKFAEQANLLELPFLDVEFRYQLQIEDVLLICRYDKILFADASHSKLRHGFEYKPCTAAHHYFFSSHLQTPETILYLAKELYDKSPEATTMAIEGQDWGLGACLSKSATRNLQHAITFFKKKVIPADRAAIHRL
jgi:hydrogenase maturation protease